MNIVIIPARSGSKRIKNKNLKFFIDAPILEYTIKNLKSFDFFDQIYVSTNSKKIKKLAIKLKVKVIDRPQMLANDHATTYDVMSHALKKIQNSKLKYLFCIYPTSVFIEKRHILDSLKIMNKKKYDYIISTKKINYYPDKLFSVKKNKIQDVGKLLKNLAKTQDMEEKFVDAAQFYLGKTLSWSEKKNIFLSKSYPINITDCNSVDIDDIQDWKLAEIIIMNSNKFNIKEDLKLIDKIEKIRSNNNINWMDILRIAMKHSPKETKLILQNINEKDKNISKLLNSLSKK